MFHHLSFSNRCYIAAFIEGASILAIELLAAKMLAPVYGASLAIWAAVIGITLISVTAGYFFGGKLSEKKFAAPSVFYLLLTFGILMAMMPVIIYPAIWLSGQFGFITGALTLSTILLFPSLCCISMLSPVLIQLIAQQVEISGKISGKVFAISTLGGIFMAFLMGFYIIPKWGITHPSLVLAGFIIFLALILFFEKKQMMWTVLFLVLFIFETTLSFRKKTFDTAFYTNLYFEEGILGQLNVIESKSASENEIKIRSLSLNGMFQSRIENKPPGNSVFYFTHILGAFSSLKPMGSSALVLGFGGGSVAKELTQLGFTIDAVDLDGRLLQVAKDYFYFDDSKTHFFADDARHFIRARDKKYDVIIIDVTLGEVNPSHVFSKECFEELKNILNKNGLVLINYTAHINSEAGIASRSVYKTLKAAGYFSYAYYKNPDRYTDVIYIASTEPVEFNFSEDRLNECCWKKIGQSDFLKNPIAQKVIEEKSDLIYTDDKPLLENISMRTIQELRESNLEGIKVQMKQGVKFFK